MRAWMLDRIAFVAGVVALLLGVAVAAAGLVIYGVSVGTNLLAGAADLLISIAVATFIVDRVNSVNGRRKWLSAYRALHGLSAAAFVDVMRVLHVYSSETAYRNDVARYEEFLDVAQMHVSDLRGTVQGFAAVIDPRVYALCRTVERRLSLDGSFPERKKERPGHRVHGNRAHGDHRQAAGGVHGD